MAVETQNRMFPRVDHGQRVLGFPGEEMCQKRSIDDASPRVVQVNGVRRWIGSSLGRGSANDFGAFLDTDCELR